MSELPEGWAETSLSDVASLNMGQSPQGEFTNVSGIGLPLIGGAADYKGMALVPSRYTSTPTKVCKPGDIILCIRATIGKAAFADREYCLGRGVAGLQPHVEPEWLKWKLFESADALDAAGVGTTFRQIDKKTLQTWPLALPPLSEQRRVVAKIDSLTGKSRRARDHLDHIPRLVEKYKQAVLSAAFRGDLTRKWRGENPSAKWSSYELDVLNEQRQSYLKARRGSRLHSNSQIQAPLPDGWFSAQLSDVGALQVGYAYKSKWYAADGVRLLRGANVAPGNVSWEDEVKLPHDIAADYANYRLDAGDIVIAMDRPIISTGLKVARISDEDAGCLLVQRVARYAASKLVDDDYVWHLINSQNFIDHAVTQATGSDLPHISSNDILTTPVPLPCLSEQREIVRKIGLALSWIDRLASEATSARRLIDRLDQAVLTKAFRGELVPQDPDEEPASALLKRIRVERDAMPTVKRGRKSKIPA